MQEGKKICVLPPAAMGANEYVISTGFMGAPTITAEKCAPAEQILSVFRAMEKATNIRFELHVPENVGEW